MEKKILGSVCLVLGIAILVTTGTSFAYFSSEATPNDNEINGSTIDFNVDLEVTPIHVATQLIPIANDLIDEAVAKETNKCIDKKGYQICTLYNVKLTNHGDAVIINGFVETVTNEYETNNLRIQLFDENYNEISDIMIPGSSSNEEMYFMNEEDMFNTGLNINQELNYYLVIWLYETGSLQNEDFSKNFSGKIGFENINGGKIEATFTS